MSDPIVILGIALILVLGVALVLVSLADSRQRQVREQVAAIALAAQPVAAVEEDAPGLLRADTGSSWAKGPAALRVRLSAMLDSTGNRVSLPQLAIAGILSLVVVGGVTVAMFKFPLPIAALMSLVAGGLVPSLLVRRARGKFQYEFLEFFPDGLDLIARAVRSGLPVFEAMEAVGQQISDPVGPVFAKLVDEMRIGVDMENVLQATAERIAIPDFKFFVVSLVLQRRTGGSLAETLGNLSEVIRSRKQLRLKARALSSEARTSAAILGALPIVVFLVILLASPGYFTVLFQDRRGHVMLGAAVFLLITGLLTMTTIIKRSLR